MIADALKDEAKLLAKRVAQAEQMKRDVGSARRLKDLAWEAIRGGADPVYVAMRYGFPIEDMKRAKEVHDQREKERLDRINRGNE